MFSLDECRYYAPCGLCTYYGRECNEVCGEKRRKERQEREKKKKIIEIKNFMNDKGE